MMTKSWPLQLAAWLLAVLYLPASASTGPASVAAGPAAVSRPACVLTLFAPTRFAAHGEGHRMDSRPLDFHYQPPAGCGKAWSRVVLQLDYAVAAGRQFDRTASLWLKGVNLWMGTTQEPGPKRAPVWRVQRDLTAYQRLFQQPGEGRYDLNNWVDQRYTSPIQVSARLLFYPPHAAAPVAPAAEVLPLSADPQGRAFVLATGADRLTRRLRFPRNSTGLYLDVIAQSQANDEQWYNCVPNAAVAQTRNYALEAPYPGMPYQECGGSAYRLLEVLLDGQAAGLAPVTAWTYTGGVDPYLWRPIADLQTLNFRPYRLDLSAFAGQVDDGREHQIELRVLGANHYFALAANLLVYADAGPGPLQGGLLQNTLAGAALAPTISLDLRPRPDGDAVGVALVQARQHWQQRGWLQTPAGRRLIDVQAYVQLRNRQVFSRPGTDRYRQQIDQHSEAGLERRTRLDGRTLQHYRYRRREDLQLDILRQRRADQSFGTDIKLAHRLRLDYWQPAAAMPALVSQFELQLQSQALTDWQPNGEGIIAHRASHSWRQLDYHDNRGGCIHRRLSSRDGVLLPAAAEPGCRRTAAAMLAAGSDGSAAYP